MSPNNFFRAFLLCLVILIQATATMGQTPLFIELETAVKPLVNEDIAAPCHYSIKYTGSSRRIRGVWLIFDRGRDVHELASDDAVLNFAHRFDLALLLHSHCPGKLEADHEDMNMGPSQGLGPSLFRALEQFARETKHPELSSASLILLGFSGAGPLSARLIGEYPNRVLAGILSAPGHFPPQGIDTVNLYHAAQQIPELIIAGGADDRSGTHLPYEYFAKYRQLGAPWTFVLQNQSPHCCTANAKALILDWLSAVLEQRLPSKPDLPLRNMTHKGEWLGFTHVESTSIKDSFGFITFNVTNAEVRRAEAGDYPATHEASWLPNALTAREWLLFVQQPSHPILPLR